MVDVSAQSEAKKASAFKRFIRPLLITSFLGTASIPPFFPYLSQLE